MGEPGLMRMLHIHSWKLCYIVKYHLLFAIYCFGPQKRNFISGLIDRTVIDITHLHGPELAEISLPAISCTFTCHKSKYVCALRTAY